MITRFADRREGGRALAEKLAAYQDRADVVVLGLARGGVPVAFEIARRLDAPLDVFIVRKLGVPGQEELAFGALAAGGTRVFNEELVRALHLPRAQIERIIERENQEIERRARIYRANRPAPAPAGKTVILVDDGLATGATMRAAIAAIRALKPKQIIAAAPVAAMETCRRISRDCDSLCFCAIAPEPFYGVGMWYRNFDQTTDAEVVSLLAAGRSREAPVLEAA